MPLDPTISLSAGQGTGQTSPFDTYTKLLQMRALNNQNMLFQQEYAAKQRVGEIAGQSTDSNGQLNPDLFFNNLQKDPSAGYLAPSVMQAYRASQVSELQMQAQRQDIMSKAYTDLRQTLASNAQNINDPSVGQALIEGWARRQPGFVLQNYGSAVSDLGKSIYSTADGSPASPQQIKQNLSQLGFDLPADTYAHAFGTTGAQMNAQGQTMPGVTAPAGSGGGFTPAAATPPAGAPGGPTPQPTPGGVGQAFGPGVSQQSYLADQGKNIASMQQDIQDDMKTLPTAIRRLDIMQSTLGNFQAGGGADMRATMAKGLQAAKNAGATFITQKMIDDVGNQSLSDSQLFDAEIKPLAIGELKSVAQGTGRVMRSEVDAFLDMMDKTKDPAALMQLLNQARYTLQVGYDQAQKFPQFQKLVQANDPSVQGFGPGDFYSWDAKNRSAEALPGTTGGGMQLGATPLTNAKGVPAPVTKRYTRDANGKLMLVPQGAQ